MKEVFIVIQRDGMEVGCSYLKAFSTKEKAEEYAKQLIPVYGEPKYDSWGLCEGTEYSVISMEIN